VSCVPGMRHPADDGEMGTGTDARGAGAGVRSDGYEDGGGDDDEVGSTLTSPSPSTVSQRGRVRGGTRGARPGAETASEPGADADAGAGSGAGAGAGVVLPRVRVLFLHGLEGGPESFKAQWLRDAEGFEVVAVDMDVSLTALVGKANSVAAHCVIHERTVAWAVLPLVVLGALEVAGVAWRARAGPLAAVACVAVWAYVLKVQARQILGSAVARVLARCVRVQHAVLLGPPRGGGGDDGKAMDHRFVPDVVVGSSFGGAVALLMVLAGMWRGPTVLLAPAWGRLARYVGARELGRLLGMQKPSGWVRKAAAWSWRDELARLPERQASRIAIYHGSADTTCPLEDSKLLVAANSNIKLTVMPKAGHRGCNRLFKDGTMGRLLRDPAFMRIPVEREGDDGNEAARDDARATAEEPKKSR